MLMFLLMQTNQELETQKVSESLVRVEQMI